MRCWTRGRWHADTWSLHLCPPPASLSGFDLTQRSAPIRTMFPLRLGVEEEPNLPYHATARTFCEKFGDEVGYAISSIWDAIQRRFVPFQLWSDAMSIVAEVVSTGVLNSSLRTTSTRNESCSNHSAAVNHHRLRLYRPNMSREFANTSKPAQTFRGLLTVKARLVAKTASFKPTSVMSASHPTIS